MNTYENHYVKWEAAPEWANVHVIYKDGSGRWFASEPNKEQLRNAVSLLRRPE